MGEGSAAGGPWGDGLGKGDCGRRGGSFPLGCGKLDLVYRRASWIELFLWQEKQLYQWLSKVSFHPAYGIAMDFDVLAINLCNVPTCSVIALWLFSPHPPSLLTRR
jgi:hypothetical protein